MKKVILPLILAGAVLFQTAPASSNESVLDSRLLEAKHVFQAFTLMPEDIVPRNFVDNANVILIFPNYVRGGFLYAAKFGLGIGMVKNSQTGEWSPPAFMRFSGGSFGLQVGAQWTDLILVGNGEASMVNFLQNRFAWGGNMSATAGPWGRNIEYNFDWTLSSSLYAYSASRGFYASIATDGSVLSFDDANNEIYYGTNIRGADVLFGNVVIRTPAAKQLIEAIETFTLQRQAQNQGAVFPEPQTTQVAGVTYPEIVDPKTKSILLVKNVAKNIKIYFDYNSAKLRPDAIEILSDASDIMRRNEELSVVVSGHTDIRGPSYYNIKLGLQRAEVIREFFLDSGVRPERIKVTSRGEMDAIAPPSDLTGMQKDRYARFVIAELVKKEIYERPSPSMRARAISDDVYMTEEEYEIESDIKVATREYVIKEGDTLWNISRDQLGSGHRWKSIYALNMDRIASPDSLPPGKTILIPVE